MAHDPILGHRLKLPGAWIIAYLSPLLAVVLGIVHAAIAPVIVVGGVKPNLVLVAVVLVTTLGGFQPGITWAFVAGVTANLLVGEPLGSVPLAMLMVAMLTAGGFKLMGRAVWIYPVLAVFVGSVVADVVALGIAAMLTAATVTALPAEVIVAAALLNAAICAAVLLPARALAARYAVDDASAW